jgi:hypothetical protein
MKKNKTRGECNCTGKKLPDEKRQFRRPKYRYKENIRMGFKEISFDGNRLD